MSKRLPVGWILFIIGIILIIINFAFKFFNPEYDYGKGIHKADFSSVAYQDFNMDKSYLAVNDNYERVYIIDYEHNKIKSIIESSDVNGVFKDVSEKKSEDYDIELKVNLNDITFDENDYLYVYLNTTDDTAAVRGEYIFKFDIDGKLIDQYTCYEDFSEEASRYSESLYGIHVLQDNIYYLEYFEEDGVLASKVMSMNGDSTPNQIGQYEHKDLSADNYIKDCTFYNIEDNSTRKINNGYIITWADGEIGKYTVSGDYHIAKQFDYSVDNENDDNINPVTALYNDEKYYILDGMGSDKIYEYDTKSGKLNLFFNVREAWKEEGKEFENDDLYYDQLIKSAITDIRFEKINTDDGVVKFLGISGMDADSCFIKDLDSNNTQEGTTKLKSNFKLPFNLCFLNFIKNFCGVLGNIITAMGLLWVIVFTIRNNFTIRNKLLVIIIPLVMLLFIALDLVVTYTIDINYSKKLDDESIAISEMIESHLDMDTVLKLRATDAFNGDSIVELSNDMNGVIYDDNSNINYDNISVNIYAYNSKTGVNPIIYNSDGISYLETFYYKKIDTLKNQEEKTPSLVNYFINRLKNILGIYVPSTIEAVGDQGVCYLVSSSTATSSYEDVIKFLKDGDKIVAILDVSANKKAISEDIRSIQNSITSITLFSLVALVSFIIFFSNYIGGYVARTSDAITNIANGDFSARVTKITNDELGKISIGVNEMAKQIEQMFNDQEKFSLQAIEALVGTIDAKDTYTNGHSVRVAQYSREIAKRSGKNEKEQLVVYYAGLLHDIGKVGIPDGIINKVSRLTDDEYDIIKTHPVIGYEILNKLSNLGDIPEGAYSHHERLDGRGYPRGLKGDEIPEIARIIGVADAYDAMTSSRSYRAAMPQEKVRTEMIRGMGTQFDPQFAEIMLEIDNEREWKVK
ncbi:HDIG domain-containing protein [Acetitomaculum ruminis DSM 5522]|uniref:HDIG domain-containing protein n=1 Tax=Acetitomaculum ruminis DSM 5522 TaxID=1120918 RepID=A0A1I0VKM2_9FIRM|nr:HD domain-containing phosphohydrolase [Acetitomaculum ruminis]SFA76954.1 HDIG domain-containing protein [Acetitomaculum ruminis DSM 5522]